MTRGRGGGVLANDDVITRTTIFGKFLGCFIEFFQNFPKSLQNLDKNFQLFKDLCLDSGIFLQSFIGLVG